MNFRKLNHYLFPCQCCLCQKISEELVCTQCLLEMQPSDGACIQCGEHLPHNSSITSKSISHCGRCISQPPAFTQTIFANTYQGGAAKLVQQFKFNEALILTGFLAEILYRQVFAKTLSDTRPDIIIPIPLHPKRLKQRGFNQSYELAKQLAKKLGIPVNKKALIRSRPTTTQTGLNRKAREKNIKGAFTLDRSSATDLNQLKDKNIAIIDDVITTGATVREAAKTLNKLKPSTMTIIAIAKTQYTVDFS